MKKYLSEFIGTFLLVFCGTGAVTIDEVTNGGVSHVGVAMTFGLVVMSVIYTLGDISGAHINPAVTIAFAVYKKFSWNTVPPYIISQIMGALVASVLLKLLFPNSALLGTTLPAGPELQSFILEYLLTFFLMLTILNVSDGAKEKGLFAGIAIGGVILLEAMFAGPISGASMNPARSLAPALVSYHIQSLWLYLVAPVCGSVSAVYINKVIN